MTDRLRLAEAGWYDEERVDIIHIRGGGCIIQVTIQCGRDLHSHTLRNELLHTEI